MSKIEKLEKNYLHLYLTIFLNNFLMISSERLAVSVQIKHTVCCGQTSAPVSHLFCGAPEKSAR